MKFLVTGSAGLVGRQVIKDLLASYTDIYSCYHNSKPDLGIATPLDLTNTGKHSQGDIKHKTCRDNSSGWCNKNLKI